MSEKYEIAPNHFNATAIVVSKCRSGCEHILVHLLDENGVIQAIATTGPGVLAELTKAAEDGVRLKAGRPN